MLTLQVGDALPELAVDPPERCNVHLVGRDEVTGVEEKQGDKVSYNLS